MVETKIIAYIGKGGTGKTILSALTGKIAIEKQKKVLFIDADPAMGLATALGVEGYKTIGTAREEIIKSAKKGISQKNDDIREITDYVLLESLYESAEFCMFVMGHTNTIGCYCPVNSLLRNTIKSVAGRFDLVIIDAEAGIEQINRQVVESVHYPILVTDNSLRGAKTTVLANETINSSPSMKPLKTGVIFNRVEKSNEDLQKYIEDKGIPCYGSIPADLNISMIDADGLSPLNIDKTTVAVEKLRTILEMNDIL
ncbi:MAG: AAA family ATPase [Deltaproteobacteria bacterium]|nr:AAA family ATPase [Deltaproteobacteria bacterium]